MPLNASPVVTCVAALQQKIAAATPKLRVDSGFYGGLVPGNLAEIESLLDAGVLGLKAFMVHSGLDEFPAATEADLRAAMPILAKRGALLLAHAELDGAAPALPSPLRRYTDYMNSRPPEWELSAIRLLIDLCRETGCRTHIVHLATAEALPLIRAARGEGLPLTVETCPHYLYFESSQVSDGDTRFKCAPPIRDAANREALWEGLREGLIDTIGSDHSPCPPELKQLETGDFGKAWGGISSLQWTLSTVWTGARKRGFSLEDVVRWTSATPAQLLGLDGQVGALLAGKDANFVIWEPEQEFEVTSQTNYHRHKLTPYEGRHLFGRVRRTVLRGQTVYDDGTFTSELKGRVILGHA
jgi:allantoinase